MKEGPKNHKFDEILKNEKYESANIKSAKYREK